MRRHLSISFAALLLTLSACSNFAQDGKVPLEGERISVLQLQNDLLPDPALEQAELALPQAWTNRYWPQNGGYPNHAMGHLDLDAELKKAWEESVGKGGGRRAPLTSAPIVAEGLVFTIDTRGTVRAFDLKTGKSRWQQNVVPKGEEDTGLQGGGLGYAAGRLYVTSGYKYLAAINPETGHMIWSRPIASPARSAPTVADDRVYVITMDNKLLVFAASDGAPLWDYKGVSETTNLLGAASVAADKSLVVLPLSSGEIFGLRPENGRVVWEDNLSAVRKMGALSSIADIRGLPVLEQGVVYAVSYSGRLVAIDQVTGRRLWQRETGSAETPYVAGAHLFIVTADQQLVALSRQDGGIHWVADLPRYEDDDKEETIVWTGPVLAGGRLIVASSGGRMMELDPQSGKVVRETKLPGSVTVPPVVADGSLLLLTEDGRLAVYR
ncbi:MAG: PQQ-binding-like beta-propeller repeat protein [Alphaproteobacteria bacterium]|nr:PQQ-binding-like beta-propeller repeat protein [Alphaproteobacteria bacterium]